MEPFQFLTSSEESIISFVNEKLPFHGSNRVGITIHVKLCKPLEEERVTVYFHSPMERVAHELVQDDFINMIDAIISQLNVYCSGGSGWVVETLKTLEIRIAGPFKGTASSFIETPAELKNVYRSLLNIKNIRRVLLSLLCTCWLISPEKARSATLYLFAVHGPACL